VPPKLLPFNLQATKEGGKIFATCVAEQGDPPPSLKWMKDNLVLGVTSDIKIHSIGESALVLQITQVTQSHAGNFSCLAENSAGKVIHTSELIVHGKHLFTIELLTDTKVTHVHTINRLDFTEKKTIM
jgi:hypothetical protein